MTYNVYVCDLKNLYRYSINDKNVVEIQFNNNNHNNNMRYSFKTQEIKNT